MGGKGKFNEAFRLKHKKRKGEFIAIKVPLTRMYKRNFNESDITRINEEYEDEYELQKEWEHLNVIKVLGHGYLKIDTLGGREKSYKEKTIIEREQPRKDLEVPFIAMEIAKGGTLKDVIDQEKKNGTYSSGDESSLKKHNAMVTRRMRQILEGLNYLHRNGIGHGDMNLGNVLVFNTPYGEVLKLADIKMDERSVYSNAAFRDSDFRKLMNRSSLNGIFHQLLDLNDSTRLLGSTESSQWPHRYKLAMDFRQSVQKSFAAFSLKNRAALALKHEYLKDATSLASSWENIDL